MNNRRIIYFQTILILFFVSNTINAQFDFGKTIIKSYNNAADRNFSALKNVGKSINC